MSVLLTLSFILTPGCIDSNDPGPVEVGGNAGQNHGGQNHGGEGGQTTCTSCIGTGGEIISSGSNTSTGGYEPGAGGAGTGGEIIIVGTGGDHGIGGSGTGGDNGTGGDEPGSGGSGDGGNDGTGGDEPGSGGADGTGGDNGTGGEISGNGGSVGSGGIDQGTGGTNSEPHDPVTGPSHLVGKAPLYVYFDGVVALEEFFGIGSEEFDFMNYTFIWDFDSEGDTVRHRYGVGFNVGHVFEETREYIVTLSVFDEHGDFIPDPNNRLSWEITPTPFDGDIIYVANRTDGLAGDGSINNPFSSVLTAIGNAKNNTQVLLRRGDTFVVNKNTDLKVNGDVFVGTYPREDNPNAPNPIIHTTQIDGAWYMFSIMGSGWRFKDIKFTGEGATMTSPRVSGGIQTLPNSHDNLIIDCQFENLAGNVIYISGNHNAVFDSDISQYGNYAFYMYDPTGGKHSIVGNRAFDMGGNSWEHVLRMQGANHSYIAENHFEATHSKSNVQIRGNSTHIVIWNNVLDRVSNINPQNNTSEEYQRYVIFDSNIIIGREDPSFSTQYLVRQDALRITAKDITVRNNVFYNYQIAIIVNDHPLVGPSERVDIYNNSIICDGGNCVGLASERVVKDINFFGNIITSVSPSTTGITAILWRSDITELTSDYNFSYRIPGSGFTRYEYTTPRTLAVWKNLTGQDMHSFDNIDPGLGTIAFVEDDTLVSKGGSAIFVNDFIPMWAPTTTNSLDIDIQFTPALDLYFQEHISDIAGAIQ